MTDKQSRDPRQARLEAALRANLHRRKMQARAREADGRPEDVAAETQGGEDGAERN